MTRHLSILAFTLAFAIVFWPVHAASGGSVWVAKDISVIQTVPGQDGAANTRLEIGANGDARITVDIRDGSSRTKGTIILVAGRWMLTQGFTPTPGAEIDSMDIAGLNSQLVMKLLESGLSQGPPIPGLPQHVAYSEKTNPIKVATSSASGQYGSPWTVDGTVTVESSGAPASYQLSFTFTNHGRPVTMNLAGSVADPGTVVSFPDSMKLDGWTIHKIGPYQQQYPGGTTLDYGARPQTPKAATVGELRKLQ
jgi:hypothetical protein